MNNLKEYKLEEVIEKVIDYRGKTPKKMGGDWSNSGYRVISALNVHNGFIDNEEQIRCVNEEVYKNWMQEKIKRNDLFLASEGASLGENCIWDSDEDIVLGQRLYAIRTNKELLDPWFFAMYMQSKKFRLQIEQCSTGSTVFGISQPILLNLKILLPNIDIQRKIGKLYKRLRNKILINAKINDNLEELLSTLYQRWFLEYEFKDKEGKSYKTNGGKFVYNEKIKKEIPEGWKVENCYKNTLFEILKPGIEYFESKNYLATGNINNEGITDGDWITFENRESRANMQPIVNSIWFAKMKNSIKHLTLVKDSQWFINKYILSTGFLGIKCKNNSLGYMHSFIYSEYFENVKNMLAHGATQEAINNDDLKHINLIIPTQDVLAKYEKITENILRKKDNIINENQRLTELKEYLLPLLMNGQINVDNIEI